MRTEVRNLGIDPVTNRPILSVVTVVDPATNEYTGMREYEVSQVLYEKYLRLTARENAEAGEGQPPSEIWLVDVTRSRPTGSCFTFYLPVAPTP